MLETQRESKFISDIVKDIKSKARPPPTINNDTDSQMDMDDILG